MSDEALFDQDGVKITATRAVFRGTTYPINGITSVGMKTIAPDIGGAALLGVLGILLLLAAGIPAVLGWAMFTDSNLGGLEGALNVWAVTAFMVVGGLVLVGVSASATRKARARYAVVLGTAGGDRQAYTSRDKAVVEAVQAAVERAIEMRG